MHPPSLRCPVIGLVGGVGAGKSQVADLLAELGCAVVRGDTIGHALLAEPEVQRWLEERWGPGIRGADGTPDRQAIGRIVFGKPAELAALNAVMAPRIRAEIERQLDALRRRQPPPPGIVLDAAVLFEAGWDDLCTHVVFVQASEQARRQRVRASRGWDEATWRAREKSQISLDCKRARCCYEVDNSSSVSRLREQIRRFFHTELAVPDRRHL